MIIWRGAGWLTLIFILLAVGLSTAVLEPVYRSISGFECIPMWVQPVIFLLIGAVLIVLNLATAITEVALREGA